MNTVSVFPSPLLASFLALWSMPLNHTSSLSGPLLGPHSSLALPSLKKLLLLHKLRIQAMETNVCMALKSSTLTIRGCQDASLVITFFLPLVPSLLWWPSVRRWAEGKELYLATAGSVQEAVILLVVSVYHTDHYKALEWATWSAAGFERTVLFTTVPGAYSLAWAGCFLEHRARLLLFADFTLTLLHLFTGSA